MNLKNFFHIILLSFYSKGLYLNVGECWRNWGLRFLLNFSILTASITSITMIVVLYSFDFNNEKTINFIKQIPKLTIENNIAHLKESQISFPLRIKSPGNNQDLIIVDLTIQNAEKYNQNALIFTSDRIALNFANDTSFDIPYSDLFEPGKKTEINSALLIDILNITKKKAIGTLLVLGIPLGSLFIFTMILLKSLFYSLLANIFMKFFNNNWNLKKLTRLAIIANIPSLLMSFFISIFFFEASFTPIIQFIIGSIFMFYFVLAIITCNNNSNKQEKIYD